MSAPVENGPIFVVGSSRSGTALMRSLLSNHPMVHLAGETHYFDDLRLRMPDGGKGRLGDEQKVSCEDYLLALTHRPYSHGGDPDLGSMSRDELRSAVGNEQPTADEYFEAYCRLIAKLNDAPVWGEKTPRHVFRIDDVLNAFPGARVVAMMRDPRAIVASYRDWKNQGGFDFEKDPGHRHTLAKDHQRARRSYNILIQCLLWKGAARAVRRYRGESDARVQIIRYEDLVECPESTMRNTARWLGLEYDESLVDAPMLNSSFTAYDAGGGFCREAAARWKEKLSPKEVHVIQRCLGTAMNGEGYSAVEVPKAHAAYVCEWLRLPWAVARAALANRKRMEGIVPYIARRLRPAQGRTPVRKESATRG